MSLLGLVALVIWGYLLLGRGKFWQAGPMLAPARGAAQGAPPLPPVTVVVPARNEAASIAPALRSLLAQDYPGALRVVLVDDQSTDGTGELARGIGDPRLTVIAGQPPPPGWSGKLWALQQGIAVAEDSILLLTDADIVHAPAHLATLVDKLAAEGLDMVSEMVALTCETTAERALVPAFVFFFQLLYPFAWVNNPADPAAAAAGGTVLIRAAALARIGGLAAMQGALIDDVTLARKVKQGGPIWLGHSRLATSIRPYRHVAEIWRMVARCAYVQLDYSLLKLAGTVASMALVFLLPPALALFGHGAGRVFGWLGWAAMAAAYGPTLGRFGLSPGWGLALPGIAAFYTAATVGSALDHYFGRGVVWKERAYPA